MSDTATPPQSLLMGIPLELRYKVFEAVAARSNPPEHLFVHWFEKKEITELIRNHVAANPDAPPPIARYTKYKPEPESESEDENEDEDEDGDSEMDDEESDQAAEDEDEDMDGEDDDVDDEDQVEPEDEDEAEPEDEDMDGTIDEQVDQDDIHVPNIDVDVHQAVQIPAATASHPDSEIEEPAIPLEVTGEEQEQEHEDNGDAAAMVSDNTTEAVIGATDATNATADADTDATVDATTTQPAQPPPPPPRPAVFKASPKWRHVAKFMKITHCPPPMELLLSSKALNHEAMDWYYDAAILHIQATSGTIAHTSFFEEALNQIADAAFSPVENIRKVDVTFVWDSAWIHAQDNHEILEMILPALLHERARFILGILKRAPALKELVIHWHDSLQDNNSTDMKLEILESFLELPASVNVVEHFIEPDAKPYRKSVAGKFRMELQGIADRGFDAFYG